MSVPFRLATPEERAYYEGILYPLQDRILAVAATYGDALVLTGGTALARLYLNHRYSDDIDLFTLQGHAGTLGRDFANELGSNGFVVEPVTEAVAFMRMWVGDGEQRVQVDVAPDAHRVEPPEPSGLRVYTHTLRDIAANKIGAFENRTEVKDAVDLYHLTRRFTWQQLFDDAETKRVPIAYDDLRHFLETPLRGSALLVEPIAEAEFARFVTSLRDEVAAEVKKKVTEYRLRLDSIVADLLWDTPRELRTINDQTRDVLERRAPQLPLPQRIALLEALAAA
ncbi:MAG TPA: nucleotidyl transferase AbiEii/AbiGii toxin family protein [Candidatus Elarobacter sp.]|nr:nucleotidyl transferase AbiEii/AbiGii toxin family protein [Candidatus Elarobacter sp.]